MGFEDIPENFECGFYPKKKGKIMPNDIARGGECWLNYFCPMHGTESEGQVTDKTERDIGGWGLTERKYTYRVSWF